MSGHVGDLSPQQEAALEQFKAALQDIPNKPDDTDYYYLRWLRARKFDVEMAELMFRNVASRPRRLKYFCYVTPIFRSLLEEQVHNEATKHIEFRKKYGLDTILEEYTPPQLFKECLPGGFFGEDVDGHPVWYENIGNVDAKGLYRSVKSLDELIKFSCYNREKRTAMVKKVSKEKGRHIEQITVVIDFKNLSFHRHYHWPSITMFKELLKTLEANDPESTRRLLFVNTPSVFPFIYNIVKRVVDERTRNKIIMFGINCNLREEIQKYISLDQLPALYGGDRYEPDAECSDYIRHGGDVDPKYYLTNCTETSKEEMERVVVGRGSSHKVRHQVAEPGSTLQWEFFTTDYDIAFELSVVVSNESGKNSKQIIYPSSRVESHLFPQNGQHKCLVAGEYIFKFDNSYSWMRAKEVYSAIKALPPDVEPEALPEVDTQNLTVAGSNEQSSEAFNPPSQEILPQNTNPSDSRTQ